MTTEVQQQQQQQQQEDSSLQLPPRKRIPHPHPPEREASFSSATASTLRISDEDESSHYDSSVNGGGSSSRVSPRSHSLAPPPSGADDEFVEENDEENDDNKNMDNGDDDDDDETNDGESSTRIRIRKMKKDLREAIVKERMSQLRVDKKKLELASVLDRVKKTTKQVELATTSNKEKTCSLQKRRRRRRSSKKVLTSQSLSQLRVDDAKRSMSGLCGDDDDELEGDLSVIATASSFFTNKSQSLSVLDGLSSSSHRTRHHRRSITINDEEDGAAAKYNRTQEGDELAESTGSGWSKLMTRRGSYGRRGSWKMRRSSFSGSTRDLIAGDDELDGSPKIEEETPQEQEEEEEEWEPAKEKISTSKSKLSKPKLKKAPSWDFGVFSDARSVDTTTTQTTNQQHQHQQIELQQNASSSRSIASNDTKTSTARNNSFGHFDVDEEEEDDEDEINSAITRASSIMTNASASTWDFDAFSRMASTAPTYSIPENLNNEKVERHQPQQQQQLSVPSKITSFAHYGRGDSFTSVSTLGFVDGEDESICSSVAGGSYKVTSNSKKTGGGSTATTSSAPAVLPPPSHPPPRYIQRITEEAEEEVDEEEEVVEQIVEVEVGEVKRKRLHVRQITKEKFEQKEQEEVDDCSSDGSCSTKGNGHGGAAPEEEPVYQHPVAAEYDLIPFPHRQSQDEETPEHEDMLGEEKPTDQDWEAYSEFRAGVETREARCCQRDNNTSDDKSADATTSISSGGNGAGMEDAVIDAIDALEELVDDIQDYMEKDVVDDEIDEDAPSSVVGSWMTHCYFDISEAVVKKDAAAMAAAAIAAAKKKKKKNNPNTEQDDAAIKTKGIATSLNVKCTIFSPFEMTRAIQLTHVYVANRRRGGLSSSSSGLSSLSAKWKFRTIHFEEGNPVRSPWVNLCSSKWRSAANASSSSLNDLTQTNNLVRNKNIRLNENGNITRGKCIISGGGLSENGIGSNTTGAADKKNGANVDTSEISPSTIRNLRSWLYGPTTTAYEVPPQHLIDSCEPNQEGMKQLDDLSFMRLIFASTFTNISPAANTTPRKGKDEDNIMYNRDIGKVDENDSLSWLERAVWMAAGRDS